MITKKVAKEIVEGYALDYRSDMVDIIDALCEKLIIAENMFPKEELKKDIILVFKVIVENSFNK